MFYDNLKAACEKNGVKMTPTIIECGGTKGVISGWKNGAAPNSDIVIKLSVRLNVSTDFLLLGRVPHDGLSPDALEIAVRWDALDADGKALVRAELVRAEERKK